MALVWSKGAAASRLPKHVVKVPPNQSKDFFWFSLPCNTISFVLNYVLEF